MKLIYLIAILFVSNRVCIHAQITLKDLLSIDPNDLLKGPDISDAEKKQIIDCVGENSTGIKCPDVPLTNALKQLKDLVQKTKQESKPKGLISGILGGILGTVKNVTSTLLEVGTAVIPEEAKKADALLKLFEKVKSNFVASQSTKLPEDPYQDVGDYLRKKHESDEKFDVLGAAQTRKSLVDTFATTKKDVLYKYGSNYNPLILVKFAGLIRMFLDIV